mgnify:CR=1 FL=1
MSYSKPLAGIKIIEISTIVTASLATMMMADQGAEVIKINCKPDGNFSHNPEPLDKNLSDLKDAVLSEKADLGIAVDPDVDRLVFVCDDGVLFGEENTIVACCDFVLSKTPGSTVSNMSSSMSLQIITKKYGCEYYNSKVGEVNVVEKMKEVKAVIGLSLIHISEPTRPY